MPQADFNGTILNYEVRGNGPPVIMLTGLGASGDYWNKAVGMLKDDHTVVTMDNRGSGKTVWSGAFTIDDLADDAIGLMDILGMDSADVVGWSMGSQTVQSMAIRHPERVNTLTVVSSYRFRPARSRYILTRMVDALEEGTDVRHYSELLNSLCHTEEFFAERERTNSEVKLSSLDPVGLRAQLDAVNVYDTTETAKTIRAPTLSVHGKDDIMVECREGDALAWSIKNCRAVRLNGVGHYVPTGLYIPTVREHIAFNSR